MEIVPSTGPDTPLGSSMPMPTRVITLTGLLLAASYRPLVGQQSVTLLQPHTVLTVDSGSKSTSGVIHLRNAGASKARVDISAGEFINQTTEKGINAKTTFFGQDDSARVQVLRIEVPPQDVAHVRVEISNLWEAGESQAAVLVNGDTIGTLRAVKYRVPFNVKLRASATDPPELVFNKDTDVLLDLKNDDGMTYRVVPTLWVKGQSHLADTVVLPPNGSGTVKISPPGTWFRHATFLKPDQADGVLTLRLDPPGTQSDAGWPAKTIPFKARLLSVTPFWQDVRVFGFILVLLLLGAIASLLVRYWVPNSLGRAALKERLDDLAEKTRMLSGRTSSEIRVGLRVERQRLLERLNLRWTFSPELPALFTQIGQRIDELLKHVALTEKVNELWAQVEDLYNRNEASSRVSAIEDDVGAINASLKKVPSSLTELDTIEKKIGAAVAKIGLLAAGPDAAWKKELEEDFTLLAGERKQLETAYPGCAHLFSMWDVAWAVIPPMDYGGLDTRISLLKLIKQDIEGFKNLNPKRAAAIAVAQALKDVLYRPARKVAREIRTRVYREEIEAALKDKAERPEISLSQTKPRRHSPVLFTLEFADRRLESPDALDPITCEWKFGDGTSPETGWRVTHYFANEGTYQVSTTFHYQNKPVKEIGSEDPVTITKEVTAQKLEGQGSRRTHAEWVQLGIAVLIALLGLMAGAREQLAKLDLVPASVALFLLGFGVDAIKTALAPPKTTP
jgi:PKD domain-containing protein